MRNWDVCRFCKSSIQEFTTKSLSRGAERDFFKVCIKLLFSNYSPLNNGFTLGKLLSELKATKAQLLENDQMAVCERLSCLFPFPFFQVS